MWSQPPQKPSNNAWIGVVVGLLAVLLLVGLVAVIGAFFFLRAKTKSIATARAAASWSDSASPVPVTSQDPIWGDRAAPVTMVVFADFEDPFSARLGTTIDSLKSLYGASELRVAWKHQPLSYHSNAHEAAEASAAVLRAQGRGRVLALRGARVREPEVAERDVLRDVGGRVRGRHDAVPRRDAPAQMGVEGRR